MKEEVILINEANEVIGQMEKMEAHQKGLLHRAFSVFLFNEKGEWLLQKRANTKYHSSGLWTNSCCGHPRPGEDIVSAAQRRLNEELGIQATLQVQFEFQYQTNFDNLLTENEWDYVLLGKTEASPLSNPDEVDDWKWISPEAVQEQIQLNPEQFTYWFKHIVNHYLKQLIITP
ncbi:MAG: isopentenyl-diphosphate Delta-isomerase [Chitinophagaceae bacterium]